MPSSRAKRLKRLQRVGVRDVRVGRAAVLAQPRVLRADRGVVEAGGNGMRQLDVAVGVLQDPGARALQHAGRAAREPCGVPARPDRFPAGFDADQLHAAIVDERVEDADGVAAAADAGDHGVGQPADLRLSTARAPRGR